MAQAILTPQTPDGFEIVSTESFFFEQNAFVFHDDGRAITVSNGADNRASLFLANTVLSTASDLLGGTIGLDGNDRVVIASTGSVAGGLDTDTSAFAIEFAGPDNVLTNHGTVAGASGIIASASGATGGYVTNSGLIDARVLGVSLVSGTLVNSGTISGGVGAVMNSGENAVVNTGLIAGGAGVETPFPFGIGVMFGSFGAPGGSDINFLNNSGTIDGGVDFTAGFQIAVLDGDLDALFFEIVSTDNQLFINNSGVLNGNVLLLGGDDSYRGRGTGEVNGIVLGGAGDDVLRGSLAPDVFDGGEGQDFLRGGGGQDLLAGGDNADTVLGNDGDDLLFGGGSGDSVNGGAGDDSVSGDGGVDIVRGGDGEDSVDGGAGNDDVHGGDGNDFVDGGTGEDTVRGGNGNDTVSGGRDKDQLFGGRGSDTFVIAKTVDSPNDSTRDTIKDFEIGEDLIDLSGLPGRYDFIGDSGFSGSSREVRVVENASGNSTVFVDTDRDGTADVRLIVEGVTGLTESDFLL